MAVTDVSTTDASSSEVASRASTSGPAVGVRAAVTFGAGVVLVGAMKLSRLLIVEPRVAAVVVVAGCHVHAVGAITDTRMAERNAMLLGVVCLRLQLRGFSSHLDDALDIVFIFTVFACMRMTWENELGGHHLGPAGHH